MLLLGYGVRGQQWQDALRRSRDVELVGVVDPDQQAQEQAGRDGLRPWGNLEDALARTAADGAIVSSPPWSHPEQAIACLRQGLAVLVEKPFALSLADASAVAAEADRAGRPVVVAQNFRFLPRERAIAKILAAGEIGQPLSAVVISARPSSAARPHLAQVENGPVWDICLHHLDALRTRFGGVPEAVTARVHRLPDAAPETFELSLRWPSGLFAAYRHSEGAAGYYHSEWIEGDRRAILVHDQKVSLFFPNHRPRRVRPPRGATPERAVLEDFLAALKGERSSTLGARDNLGTVATVEAAIASLALGREVSVSEIASAAGLALAQEAAP